MTESGQRRAAKMYAALVDELRREFIRTYGREHGWRAWAGRKLGVTASHVIQVHNGTRRAALDAIERAIKELNLRREYFFEPHKNMPSYHDFRGPGVRRADESRVREVPASFRQWRERMAPADLSAEIEERMLEFPFDFPAESAYRWGQVYDLVAAELRERRPPDSMVAEEPATYGARKKPKPKKR